MSASSEECAREVLEVVPLIMWAIRTQMRSHRTPDLTVVQFRTLAFLGRNEGASLSDLAEHMGLTHPSASKLVDVLVGRLLIDREASSLDRRRIRLTLTKKGASSLRTAREAAQSALAERFATLSPGVQATVGQAMLALRSLFAPGTPQTGG